MPPTRRPDIDWLRVIATYLLFVFHVGKVFDPAPFFHIRNPDLSFIVLVGCGFLSLWHMPLFFVLAGWSAAQSLDARGPRGFLAERARRLAVPLLAGSALLGPVIKFFELRSGLDLNHATLRVGAQWQEELRALVPGGLPLAAPFHEGFREFLPTFYTQLDRFTWAHLWFVAYLLAFTVCLLPAFVGLLRRRDRLAGAGAWVLYLPLVPLAGIQLTLRGRWPGIYNLYNDWANVAFYGVFVVSGFLLATQPALERQLWTEWRRSLAIGGAVTIVLLGALLGVFSSPAVPLVGTAVAAWCFVLAGLGLAHEFMNTTTPRLAYLSESAFPVYVLHQAAIVVPGYFLVALPLGIAAKFTLLLCISLGLTLGTYHWLVRPLALPRFLLGMKPNICPMRPTIPLAHTAVPVGLAMIYLAASPAIAAAPNGLWFAEGGAAQVAIEPCGPHLCGRVVWLRSPFDEDGCDLRDRHNPDPTLRDRPIEGLGILHGLSRQNGKLWGGGTIYDPGSGSTYSCSLELDGPDRLSLRGYLGIPLLGRTAMWFRVGSENRLCRGAAR